MKKKSKPKTTKITQKEKSKFRSTSTWKQFRVDRISSVNGFCECCGRKFDSPRLHLHHKDLNPDHYTNISNPDNFAVLCSPCHDMLHWAHTLTISKKNPTTNKNIKDLQSPFFI